MQTLKKIDALIVVEGKNDEFKLKQVLDADIICTQGLSMPDNVLMDIVEIAKHREVIICTDPDSPGNKIRQKITELVPSAKQVYFLTEDARGKNKIGIEHASNEKIIEAFEHIIEAKDDEVTLTWNEYISLGLIGIGSSKRRAYLAKELHLGLANAKTFYHRLNMIKATFNDLERILENV
jgi:ribonuclease M5